MKEKILGKVVCILGGVLLRCLVVVVALFCATLFITFSVRWSSELLDLQLFENVFFVAVVAGMMSGIVILFGASFLQLVIDEVKKILAKEGRYSRRWERVGAWVVISSFVPAIVVVALVFTSVVIKLSRVW